MVVAAAMEMMIHRTVTMPMTTALVLSTSVLQHIQQYPTHKWSSGGDGGGDGGGGDGDDETLCSDNGSGDGSDGGGGSITKTKEAKVQELNPKAPRKARHILV